MLGRRQTPIPDQNEEAEKLRCRRPGTGADNLNQGFEPHLFSHRQLRQKAGVSVKLIKVVAAQLRQNDKLPQE